MSAKKQKTIIYAMFIVYFLLLVGVILFKLPFYSPELSDGIRVINLIPFQGSFDENGSFVIREVIQNIAIFIPLGIYVSMLKKETSVPKMILMILVFSLCLEVLQFMFAIGRSDITDVIGNTLGGLIGIALYVLLSNLFKDRTDKIVNTIAVIATMYITVRFSQLFYLSHFVMRQLER